MSKNTEYTCDACRQRFVSALTRRELEVEFKKNYPGETKDEPGIMCDDCWTSFRLGVSYG